MSVNTSTKTPRQYRAIAVEELIALVVRDLLPSSSVAECLHNAGIATDLDLTAITNLVAEAAEAQDKRDRLQADPDEVWAYVPDEYVPACAGPSAVREVADAVAMTADDELASIVARLAMHEPMQVAS